MNIRARQSMRDILNQFSKQTKESTVEMSHAELYDAIKSMLGEVDAMFRKKNEQYGSTGDALYNFRAGAKMAGGTGTAHEMLDELLGYVRKHLVTIQDKGLSDPDLKERCIDVAVYHITAAVMAEKYGAKKVNINITNTPGSKEDGPCTKQDD